VSDSSNRPAADSARLTAVQRLALALVYPPPLSWHPLTARLFGVKLVPAVRVDASALEQAERDSYAASRSLGLCAAWAGIGVVLTAFWAPVLGLINLQLVDRVFAATLPVTRAAGLSRGIGADVAYVAAIATVLITSLVSVALVFVPLVALGRRSILAGSSALSLALRFRLTGELPDLSRYPRLNYALGRLLRGGQSSS